MRWAGAIRGVKGGEVFRQALPPPNRPVLAIKRGLIMLPAEISSHFRHRQVPNSGLSFEYVGRDLLESGSNFLEAPVPFEEAEAGGHLTVQKGPVLVLAAVLNCDSIKRRLCSEWTVGPVWR